ncbi:MAG: secernin [Bacillota bacterium]
MCDTFYVKEHGSGASAFFLKNSDRDPNEPQYMFFVPSGKTSHPKTYVSMPSYEVKYATWLSKPSWMWGAEMGVNEKGVAIGNEATFNKPKVDKIGVLGMDHLRVALELSSSSREALEILIENTEKYGQGGNGGYEHPLYYHNSYLITDSEEGYILDTVNRDWAYKKLRGNYNISNKISIKDDFDEISSGLKGKVQNLEKHFINPLVSYFAGAYHRENRGRELMQKENYDLKDAMAVLQDRHTGRVATMRNICMIAGGLVSSQTTASLFYDYSSQLIWYTEGPNPEVQLFKPLKLGFHYLEEEDAGVKRWKYNNLLFRTALKDYEANKDRLVPLRTQYQSQLLALASSGSSDREVYERSHSINKAYIDEGLNLIGEGPLKGGIQFKRYWRKENQALLDKETDPELRELYERYLV